MNEKLKTRIGGLYGKAYREGHIPETVLGQLLSEAERKHAAMAERPTQADFSMFGAEVAAALWDGFDREQLARGGSIANICAALPWALGALTIRGGAEALPFDVSRRFLLRNIVLMQQVVERFFGIGVNNYLSETLHELGLGDRSTQLVRKQFVRYATTDTADFLENTVSLLDMVASLIPKGQKMKPSQILRLVNSGYLNMKSSAGASSCICSAVYNVAETYGKWFDVDEAVKTVNFAVREELELTNQLSEEACEDAVKRRYAYRSGDEVYAIYYSRWLELVHGKQIHGEAVQKARADLVWRMLQTFDLKGQ